MNSLYLAQLYTGPLLEADAIVVLAGEDAESRCATALQLFKQGAARTILCAGGVSNPPTVLDADACAKWLLGEGVPPSAIETEGESRNTHQQAVNVLGVAAFRDWHRLLLVASAYHVPRAYLTFVAALGSSDIHVVPMADYAAWSGSPPGHDRTRAELFHVESVKIAEYQAVGHCATYEQGIAYLGKWERP